MTKPRAISFLLVVLLLATLVSPGALQAATVSASAPQAQSVSASVLSWFDVLLILLDPALVGVVCPFEPPAGIVER